MHLHLCAAVPSPEPPALLCLSLRWQSHHAHESEYVYVDAHVLATPAIADIDGDGHEELVLSVSYFYDKCVRDAGDRRACGGNSRACCRRVCIGCWSAAPLLGLKQGFLTSHHPAPLQIRDYYDDPAHAGELQGVDKDKYVAGGWVVLERGECDTICHCVSRVAAASPCVFCVSVVVWGSSSSWWWRR